MADFLATDDPCGQALLKLTSRGVAIITEILRLADFVPAVFRLQTKEDRDRYGDIIQDFRYFTTVDAVERKISSNSDLQELDDEFQENHLEILSRFFLMFESIYKYAVDLNHYIEDLDDGNYIHQTVEKVLLDRDGKQLLVEAIYQYGVMLLTVDQKIEGVVRERLLVSCYRYLREKDVEGNMDKVCRLLRATKFQPGLRRPAGYPEELFERYLINAKFVDMAISRLVYDDIYNQLAYYPLATHRSTALASQAAILFVVLYFKSRVLKEEQSMMREIVDKFFQDNWVISVYMGSTANLVEAWEPYKAAQTALGAAIGSAKIRRVISTHSAKMPEMRESLKKYQSEGTLTDEFLLDHVPRLMALLRDCNVSVRWWFLHSIDTTQEQYHARCKKLRDVVVTSPDYNLDQIFSLLLDTAALEYNLRQMLTRMLERRMTILETCKNNARDRMKELSEYFSGEKALTRVERNKQLQEWFQEMARQVDLLTFTDLPHASRRVVQIVQALDEVQEYHQLEGSLQIKEFVTSTRRLLHHIVRCINIKEDDLAVMQVVADLSYAWRYSDTVFTPLMHQHIKREPAVVSQLRTLFVKLSSATDMPLLRLIQGKSRDVESVAGYYSAELVAYVRKVLQVIPESMFRLLDAVVALQTTRIKELPTRLDKDKVKDYAQLEDRFEVAKTTHAMSVFAEGILAMKTTLVGIVCLDPKQLLEDGIRKELVRQVATALDSTLRFGRSQGGGGLEPRLKDLAQIMNGFRRSFEYIQDYVNIYGLKIWQDELSRIVNYNVEQECNSFLRKKVYDWESPYQSKAIPIPTFPSADDKSVDFIGRLGREILRLTDSRTTVYIDQRSAWYDQKTSKEVFGRITFIRLERAVGTFGLAGLDKLYSFMIVSNIQKFLQVYKKQVHKDKVVVGYLDDFRRTLEPFSSFKQQPQKVYGDATGRLSHLWAVFVEKVMAIGHKQLVRRQITYAHSLAAKVDSKMLHGTLQALNTSLLCDIERHYEKPQYPYPNEDRLLLPELASYLTQAGIGDPLAAIYATTTRLDHFPLLLFLFVVAQLPKFKFRPDIEGLVARYKNDPLDGGPFTIGIVTILRQFHSSHTDTFVALACQYVRSIIAAPPKEGELTEDGVSMLVFLDNLCRHGHISRQLLTMHLPAYLLDNYRQMASDAPP